MKIGWCAVKLYGLHFLLKVAVIYTGSIFRSLSSQSHIKLHFSRLLCESCIRPQCSNFWERSVETCAAADRKLFWTWLRSLVTSDLWFATLVFKGALHCSVCSQIDAWVAEALHRFRQDWEGKVKRHICECCRLLTYISVPRNKWMDGLWSNIVCAFKSFCCASDLDWTASWGGSFKDRLLWAARGPFVLPPLSMLAFLHTDTKLAHALPKACSPLKQFPFRHPTSWLSVCFSFPLCNAATNTLRSGRRFVVSVVSNMYVVFQSLNGPCLQTSRKSEHSGHK